MNMKNQENKQKEYMNKVNKLFSQTPCYNALIRLKAEAMPKRKLIFISVSHQ